MVEILLAGFSASIAHSNWGPNAHPEQETYIAFDILCILFVCHGVDAVDPEPHTNEKSWERPLFLSWFLALDMVIPRIFHPALTPRPFPESPLFWIFNVCGEGFRHFGVLAL